MTEYQNTYARMTDEQLLNLASDRASLLPDAMVALDSELAKRNFGQQEIKEQAECVRRGQIEDESAKPLARSFNGIGTSVYGKRSFQPDGSYITTLWIVLGWVPVIPLKSFRVKEAGPEKLIPFGWSRPYYVLNKSRPDVRQVINIYSYIVAFFLGCQTLLTTKAEDWVGYVALAVWVSLPWALRKLAKPAFPISQRMRSQRTSG